MCVRRRGLVIVGAGLLSSSCLAFVPASHQLRAGQAVPRPSQALVSERRHQQQTWSLNSLCQRTRSQRQQLPRPARRRVGGRDVVGPTIGLAAEAEAGGEETGAGAVGAAKRDLSQEEKVDEINKLIYVTETLSSSKMMTIDSFGPEQSASARRGKKGRTNNATPSKAVQEPMLPEAIARQRRLYEKRKWRLIGDNVFLGLLGTSGAWSLSFKAACSYGLGALLGTAYLVLLSRFVENLGKENQDGSGGRGGGGGGGPARLALAGLLVLIVSKNKDTFEFIPAVAGFLAYQVSTLVQGIYTDFDELEDAAAETAG